MLLKLLLLYGGFFILLSCNGKKSGDNPLYEFTKDTTRVDTTTNLKDYAGNTLIGITPGMSYPNQDPKNEEILLRDFNAIEPTWVPGACWTTRTTHDISVFVSRVNWAKAHNKKVLMHLLVGSSEAYYPEWFNKGDFSAAELDEMMDYHIKCMVTPVSDKVDIWNVTNETLYNGYVRKLNIKLIKLGMEADASGLTGANKINDSLPVYIRKAFEYTRKYTNAELELRETLFEFSNANDRQLLAFYQLAKHLKNKGLLDAVGFQCHIDGENAFSPDKLQWANLRANIKKFKDLGLKVYITELDISSGSFKDIPFTTEIANQQKLTYKRFVKESLTAAVDGIFFFRVRDSTDPSWRPYEKPCLYDWDYNRKPAYYGVLEALKE